MTTPRRLVVIITALPVEREAILQHLRKVGEEPELRGSIYRRGIFDEMSVPWDVIVAEIGAGNEGAAAEAERVIAHYSPEVALFVGVAGGIKDLKQGDVLASTKVYAYESGKDQPDGYKPRPSVQLPSYLLEQRARYEAGEPRWRQRIKGDNSPHGVKCEAKVGPIAAGEKVLSSNRSQIFEFLRGNYGDALAVEMEGHGFLLGVHMNHPTQGIVVRGISDCLNDKNPANDENWQPIAARHAAAFAFELLAKLTPKGQRNSEPPASQINFYRDALKFSATSLDWWKSAIPIYAKAGTDKDERLAREILREWVKDTCDHCVVLGNPGSGKSGLLRWLAYELATAENDSLPVIVSAAKLRQLSDVTLSTLGELAEPQVEPSLYMEHLEKRQLFMFLDGLDELVGAESGGEVIACEVLRKLCSVIPANTRVIAACRTPAFPTLADELQSSLPSRQVSSEARDMYDVAIARALNVNDRPPLIIQLLPIQQTDAESFLRNRLPHSIVDANVQQRRIRPFLSSPFMVRMLSLALPHLSGMGSVSIVDLYRIYVDAALMREKPGISRRELDSIISTLRDLADEPNQNVDADHARLARNAGLILQIGWQTEFCHHTLWEYLYSAKVHEQMVNWESQLLAGLDLVNGYYLNRFLVPMMLSELASRDQSANPCLRIVSSDEYRDFLLHRKWRKRTGYGLHPSMTLADDGTPSATFSIERTEAQSIHNDASHGTQIASGVSWYDASVFALHSGSLLPTSDQLRSIHVDGDYVFWGSEWYDEDTTHVCAFDANAGNIVGINPDVRLPRMALAVFG